MSIRSFKDLDVWQRGMGLAEACYRATEQFPKSEVFGLTSQIRRAAVSIPANIAEGWGREGTKEFIYFLRVAQGSLKELETLLELSQRLEMGNSEELKGSLSILVEVGKMTRALITSLKKRLE